MSFPSSSGTRKNSVQDSWLQARGLLSSIKTGTQNLRNHLAANPTSAKEITDGVVQLADALDILNVVKATAGLPAYAQAQLNDNTFDVVAELTTVINAITGCRDWIIANFPKDGSGYLLYIQFDANARPVYRTLSVAATAGLRTQLDLVIAAID